MIHSEYTAVFELLQKHNIRFCTLRDDVRSEQLVADLDLLVESSKFDRAIQILQTIGYGVRTTERQQPLKSVLVKIANGKFVVIDLHRTVVQNAIVLLNGDGVIERMPLEGDSFLPSSADLLTILVLHNIIGKNHIQKKHLDKIKELKEQVDFLQIRSIFCDERMSAILLRVLDDLDGYFNDPILVKVAAEELKRLYFDRDLRARYLYYSHRLKSSLRRFSLRPRAPLYALTGVDGAGKSSLAQALLDVMNQPGGFRAVILYMGPWGHYRLGWMRGELFVPGWSVDLNEWRACVFRRRTGSQTSMRKVARILSKIILRKQLSDTEKERYLSFRNQSRLVVSLRFARSIFAAIRFTVMIFAEMYYRYFLAYRARRRGVTVIADRYIYDLMTGRMHETIPQYRRLRTFLCKGFPTPTRGFLISNDAKTILKRKADLSEEMLSKHLELYEELAVQYSFTRVLTDRPARDLACEVVEQCFDEIINYARN